MTTKKTAPETPREPVLEHPVADGDTAHHDLHGDTIASAPEQAHGRGYERTLHGVKAVPRET